MTVNGISFDHTTHTIIENSMIMQAGEEVRLDVGDEPAPATPHRTPRGRRGGADDTLPIPPNPHPHNPEDSFHTDPNPHPHNPEDSFHTEDVKPSIRNCRVC